MVVRKPLRVRDRTHRTFDQRLFLLFPRLAVAFFRRISRLPPTARLRQAVLWRSVGLSLEAYNRRDLSAVVIGWAPDFEYRPGQEWAKAGLAEPSYWGLEGYQRYIASADEVWGGENRLQTTELIDLGDKILTLADGTMRAQASGVPLDQAFALLSTVEDGRIVRHQEYYDHAEALEAAGLSE
jgi:ketosteroid isomerase-like protein